MLRFEMGEPDETYVVTWLAEYKQLWRQMECEPHRETDAWQQLRDEQIRLAERIVDVLVWAPVHEEGASRC